MAYSKFPTEPPKTRQYTLGGLVARIEGKELNKPEVVYEFTGGAKKVSTDRTEKGIYKR